MVEANIFLLLAVNSKRFQVLYQLRRNDTITGPFTKETLLQQELLPTDMVKTVNDAEWKHFSDVEELKNIFASTPKPKYKITATKEVVEIKDKPETKESAMPTAGSPFKRLPSAVPKKPAQQQGKKELSEKPFVRHTNDVPNTKKIVYRKATVDDEQQENKGSSNLLKELLLPLLIIGAIGVLCWIGYEKFFITNPSSNNIPTAMPLQDTIAEAPMQDTPRAIAPQVKPLIDTAKQTLQKDSLALQKIDSPNINEQKDTTDITVKPEPKTPIPATPPAVKEKETVKPIAKNTPPKMHQKSIDDYLSLSLNKIPNKEVKDIKLNVKNIGGEPLNVAVISVSYLNSNGNFVKNETLEVDNIGAGKTVSVKIPDSKIATKVICKTSLISGDSVYLMRK